MHRAVDTLVAGGVESLAVCLLHAYVNPAHEKAIRDIVESRHPGLPVSLSCEVSPEVREFDRLSTTVADACIKPLMEGYLKDLARRAIERDIGARLGTGATHGADGISQMVDEAMANAARMHAVEQGKNLEDCTMVAFGGNGPLHATRVAEKVGVREIVVPPNPGAGSAVGFLSAPVSFELVRTHYVRIADFDAAAVDALAEDMRREAAAVVEAGSGGAPLTVTRTAFMRYRGQGHEIEAGVPRRALDAAGIAHLVAAFEADYTRLYGRIVPGVAIEVMNWSVRVSTTPESPPRAGDCTRLAAPEPVGARTLTLHHSGDATQAACYRRADLVPGDTVRGPALIVEPQTTTFVSPRFDARVDTAGNIVVPAEGASCMWDIPIRSAALSRLDGNATAFAVELTHNGGTGARPAADGLSATAYPSGVWGSQVEITEHIAPVRVRRRELIPDSGGAGRQRGGLGQIIELESSEGRPITLFTSVERTRHPARGRDGGADGRLGRISLRSGRALTGKGEHVIPEGDRLVFETPGGAGYGDPLERSTADVVADVARGLVSREAAERCYAVVFNEDGAVDENATRARRRTCVG